MFPVGYFPAIYWPEGYWARGSAEAGYFLTAVELLSLRASAAAALPDACTVSRKTVASDGQGGETWTWAVIAGYRARLRPNSGSDEVAEDSSGAVTTCKLLLPHNADIEPEDRVQFSGVDYEVIWNTQPKTERVYRMVELVRVEG